MYELQVIYIGSHKCEIYVISIKDGSEQFQSMHRNKPIIKGEIN